MSTKSASDAAKRDIEHIMLSQDCEQILKVLTGSESWESQTLDSFFVEIDFLIPEIFSQVHRLALSGVFRESAFLLKGGGKILTQ